MCPETEHGGGVGRGLLTHARPRLSELCGQQQATFLQCPTAGVGSARQLPRGSLPGIGRPPGKPSPASKALPGPARPLVALTVQRRRCCAARPGSRHQPTPSTSQLRCSRAAVSLTAAEGGWRAGRPPELGSGSGKRHRHFRSVLRRRLQPPRWPRGGAQAPTISASCTDAEAVSGSASRRKDGAGGSAPCCTGALVSWGSGGDAGAANVTVAKTAPDPAPWQPGANGKRLYGCSATCGGKMAATSERTPASLQQRRHLPRRPPRDGTSRVPRLELGRSGGQR